MACHTVARHVPKHLNFESESGHALRSSGPRRLNTRIALNPSRYVHDSLQDMAVNNTLNVNYDRATRIQIENESLCGL